MDEGTTLRFWNKVAKTTPNECWLWIPRLGGGGYGQIYIKGKQRYVHRVSYELANGPIPHGLVVDHICKVRHCVNPAHLRAVTTRENIIHARAWEQGAQVQRSKTRCPKDHPYDEANTSKKPDGSRGCRECARAASAAYKARYRLENPLEVRQPKTHCVHDHEFTPENTYVAPATGARTCRECKRRQVKAYRARPKVVRYQADVCKNGHEFDADNAYISPTGNRGCRTCARASSRAWYHRKKAAETAG